MPFVKCDRLPFFEFYTSLEFSNACPTPTGAVVIDLKKMKLVWYIIKHKPVLISQ